MTGERDTLRRQDDAMLTELTTQVALLQQGHDLSEKAADARWRAVDKSIEALSQQIASVLTVVQQGTADPAATPAGRQIIGQLADVRDDAREIERRVDSHEAIIQQVTGALRLARAAVGVSMTTAGVQLIWFIGTVLTRGV